MTGSSEVFRAARCPGGRGRMFVGLLCGVLCIAVLVGLVWAVVSRQRVSIPLLVLLTGFAPLSVIVSWIDLRTHRIPNGLIVPSLLALATAVLAEASGSGEPAVMLRVGLGAAAPFAFLVLVALILPGAVGGGDVKLIALTGGIGAWCGWLTFAVSLIGTALLAGVASSIVLRRGGDGYGVPLGPTLCAGVWLAVLAVP